MVADVKRNEGRGKELFLWEPCHGAKLKRRENRVDRREIRKADDDWARGERFRE